MVVSLGCEKLQPDRLLPPGVIPIDAARRRSRSSTSSACRTKPCRLRLDDRFHPAPARVHLERLNQRRRETGRPPSWWWACSAAAATPSGVTANPAVGFMSDLLVRAGATVMFSEVTEVRDAIDQLTARAATPEVAEAMVREMAWYDAYLQRGRVDRSANTTPGNKKGGLRTSSRRRWARSSRAAARHRRRAGTRRETARDQRGLIYAATPASDFICGTLQLAAGMNLHRLHHRPRHALRPAECPVIKVATRSELARRWHDLMDVDAGRIASGEASIEEMGWELFHRLLATASGERTWAERHRLRNALVLFNPAPVT